MQEFSPEVEEVRHRIERLTGHAMNHCVLNLYRSGKDHIGFHSDKQLDIKTGTSIVSVSLGEERIMRLRKKGSKTDDQLVSLAPGSAIVIGPETNKRWMHGVPKVQRKGSGVR